MMMLMLLMMVVVMMRRRSHGNQEQQGEGCWLRSADADYDFGKSTINLSPKLSFPIQ